MLALKSWLQEYLREPLPDTNAITSALTKGAFEIEGVTSAGEDQIFNVDVLPNRSHDALSHLGIARELSVLLTNPFVPPSFEFQGDTGVSSADALSLEVLPETSVVRAMKRLAVDVTVGPSPDWLKAKLEALGQRSINTIVDITNFVMLETGQPVHAFDFDKLAGGDTKDITIRMAKDSEEIMVLDGKTFTLSEDTVVIADDEKALDIAGVKGGAASGIDENTKRVVLSACTFNPTQIRKTSRGLGLLTDASKRFEQGISPILTERAMARLSQLVTDVAGGRVSADMLDFYPRRRQPFVIGVSTNEVNRILGTSMSDADVESILGRLMFPFEKVHPHTHVGVLAQKLIDAPYALGASISHDAPNAFDCSSFTAYVFAHAGIAIPRMSIDQYLWGTPVDEKDMEPGDLVFSKGKEPHITERVPDGVGHVGIYIGDGNVVHASAMWDKGKVVVEKLSDAPGFADPRGARRVLLHDDTRYVVTIPEERLDLHSGPGFMVSGNTEDLVEEIGRVYGYDKIEPIIPQNEMPSELNKTFYYTQKIRDILVDLGFSEVMTYSFVPKGDVELKNPIADDKKFLRTTLAEGLAEALERNRHEKPLLGVDAVKLFEIGTVFSQSEERIELGIVAETEKAVTEAFEKISEVFGKKLSHKNGITHLSDYIAELPEPKSYDDLVRIDSKGKMFTPLSPYPFVLRDIAMWAPSEVTGLEVGKVIQEEAGELLVRMTQFDEFSKEGRTSYAYHLVFQSPEKTLNDDEINAVMTRVTDTINSTQGFEVR